MDAAYLKEHVGGALSQALSQVVIDQPDDAIDFIGNFLVQYADVQQAKADEELRRTKIAEAQAAQQARDEARAKTEAEAAQQLADQAASDDAMFAVLEAAESKLNAPVDGVVNAGLGDEIDAYVGGVLNSFVEHIRSRVGATSCYIGELRTVPADADNGGAQYVRYTYATPQDKFLIGQKLVAPEGGDDEEVVPESGVTFQLFKPVEEEEEEPVPEDGEEPAPRPPKPPPTVNVANVLRDERIKYFRFPKLGAYLASLVKFQSSVHEESLNPEHLTASPYPEPAEGEEAAEDEAAAPAEGEEGGEDGEGEAAAPAPKALRVWDANVREQSLVLAVDSMGNGRTFTEDEVAFLQDAATRLGKFLERTSKHQYQAEVSLQRARLAANAAAAETAEERAAAAATAAEEFAASLEPAAAPDAAEEEAAPAEEEGGEEKAAAEEAAEPAPAAAPLSEEEKAIKLKEFATQQAVAYTKTCADSLKNLLLQVVTPPAAVTAVIEACVDMTGGDAAGLLDKDDSRLSWQLVKKSVDAADLLEKLAGLNGESFDATRAEALREKVGGLDQAGAAEYSNAAASIVPALNSVLEWCGAVQVLREKEEAERIAAEEAAAEAAAAAAEAEGDDE